MARRTNDDDFRFDGFEAPNTTPVPDVLFDRLLARLGEAELKALLYIIRRTFGFKKSSDSISFNQFLRGIVTLDGKQLDDGCGVRDRTTLSKALKSLEGKGIVLSDKGIDERGENTTTVYRLRFRDGVAQLPATALPASVVGNSYHPREVVGNSYHPGRENLPPVVGNPYPQETVKQQTARQETEVSKIRKSLPKKNKERPTVGEDVDTGAKLDSPGRAPSSEVAAPAGMTTLAAEIRRREAMQTKGARARAQEEAVGGRKGVSNDRPRARVIRARQVPHQDEAYQVIQAYIADFSRELNDRAPLRSSTTRAYNLYKRSGLDLDGFVAQLYAARSIVKERTSSIHSRGEDNAAGFPVRHRAGYYFAVLEDILGLRDAQDTASDSTTST